MNLSGLLPELMKERLTQAWNAYNKIIMRHTEILILNMITEKMQSCPRIFLSFHVRGGGHFF